MSADHACPDVSTACFAIRAVAEPGILPRLIELFAKRDLVPSALWVARVGPGRAFMLVDIHIDGLAPDFREIVAETMRQMVSVERVLIR